MRARCRERWRAQQANGDREALEGKIQERYGDDKETAKRKVDNWIDSL